MKKAIDRDKPYYSQKAISNLSKLSKTLDIRESILLNFSKNQEKHYYEFELKTSNGKVRRLKDPKTLLKKIQKRINSRIFVHVKFPDYLHGGIKFKDYYSNASAHTKAEYVFSYDVRSFYDNIKIQEVSEIFQQLLHFPPDVSQILSKLVTLNDRVPQGAPTSSYIANLIFFGEEYKIVSQLRRKGIVYTRLLDDIVISSKQKISKEQKTKISKEIAAMVKSRSLKLNNKKTNFAYRTNPDELMSVTGLWVNHAKPKCKKEEKKKIRASVYQCELNYKKNEKVKESFDYHEAWNKASGRVAKLARVGHPQAKKLRHRLSVILPIFSDEKILEIEREVSQLEKVASKKNKTMGYLKRVNRMIYYSGIVSRTDKKKARIFRNRLLRLKVVKNYEQFWEE